MKRIILVRYGEIGLKGKNRRYFEGILLFNIKQALQRFSGTVVRRVHGRYFVETDHVEEKDVIEALTKVFGIVSISPVFVAVNEIQSIKETSLTVMSELEYSGLSFKVETKRADKRFPITSPEVSRQVGEYLLANLPGLIADMHSPQQKLEIEIREDSAYIYTEKISGSGGLPVGAGGKGLLLLSGGIDSPAAGWMGMKRGVRLEALHFFSFPFTGERAKEKVYDLCRILAPYNNGGIMLHLAHFTEIQKEIQAKCPEKMLVTLMRRMMFRVADGLARRRGLQALFTGENLGQVASQTMESMAVINRVTSLLVFRPLIGFDKTEIVSLAQRINTYSVSVRPYEDCCTVFLPDYPETRPRLSAVEEAESVLDINRLVNTCLDGIEIISFES